MILNAVWFVLNVIAIGRAHIWVLAAIFPGTSIYAPIATLTPASIVAPSFRSIIGTALIPMGNNPAYSQTESI